MLDVKIIVVVKDMIWGKVLVEVVVDSVYIVWVVVIVVENVIVSV